MKDIRYIIKRILIGTGIAILLMLIKGNLAYDVHALSLSSTGGWNDNGYLSQQSIQSTGTYEKSVILSENRKYYTNTNGYFMFSFSYVNANLALQATPTISTINVKGAGGLYYPCFYSSQVEYYGNSSSSEWSGNGIGLSVVCPIRTDENGIGDIQVGFNSPSPWEIHWKCGERASFIFDSNSTQVQRQTEELNEVNNNLNELNDSINDDNVNQSSSSANSFFNNFDNGDTGNLTDIISLPLDFLSSLNNACSPISLTLPFINTNITLPCISSYLSQFIPSALLNLIRLVINAIISYRAIASLLNFINGLKDPNNSDLEVMDL